MQDDQPAEDDEIAEYTVKCLFSFRDWQAEFEDKMPFEVEAHFTRSCEEGKPYIAKMNYLCAVMDRFFELGYIDTRVVDEERTPCIERGEAVARMVRRLFADDEEKLHKFEDAYRYSKKAMKISRHGGILYSAERGDLIGHNCCISETDQRSSNRSSCLLPA